MARPRRIDPELVVKTRTAVAQAADTKTLRAAQAVLMPALAHTTLEQTAALLGVDRASVPSRVLSQHTARYQHAHCHSLFNPAKPEAQLPSVDPAVP
jgi:hypothetical protein